MGLGLWREVYVYQLLVKGLMTTLEDGPFAGPVTSFGRFLDLPFIRELVFGTSSGKTQCLR